MTLALKIDQTESYEFFKKYDQLGNLQKKIWSLVVWWCKRYPCAKPSQTKIADKIGCSRKHVNTTLALFQRWGWLTLVSRGAKHSKILQVPGSLLQIDPIKREYFKRVEVTAEVTYSYSSYRRSTSGQTGTLEICPYLKNLDISLETKLKLSLVPESIYQSALESARSDAKKGKKFENQERYLVGVALGMAKKQNIPINWRSYYATIGR